MCICVLERKTQTYEAVSDLYRDRGKLPVGSNSLEESEVLSLLGFLSGGWSLLRMLLVLEKEEEVNQVNVAGNTKMCPHSTLQPFILHYNRLSHCNESCCTTALRTSSRQGEIQEELEQQKEPTIVQFTAENNVAGGPPSV